MLFTKEHRMMFFRSAHSVRKDWRRCGLKRRAWALCGRNKLSFARIVKPFLHLVLSFANFDHALALVDDGLMVFELSSLAIPPLDC
jgi:hypothetical protein